MPAVQVLKVTDSLDGKELDPDTKPLVIAVDRRSWSLYLSDTNKAKVMKQIDDWTKDEPETTATASHATRRTRPQEVKTPSAELAKIRQWATANGREVNMRGRVPQEIKDAYYAEHPA